MTGWWRLYGEKQRMRATGLPARIIAKMNALVDRDVIDGAL